MALVTHEKILLHACKGHLMRLHLGICEPALALKQLPCFAMRV